MAGTRKPGEFCWINMLTPRLDESRAFFETLLGWTFFEMPGIGYGMKVGGSDIGGMFDLNGPNALPGAPAHINAMVKVESADAIADKVKSLGGQAMTPFDIFDAGRMSVCSDPNGADFDLWEPKNMPGTDVDSTLHGAPSWFETMTTDSDRATAFYSGLFGWTPEAKPMSGFDYTTFKLGGEFVAGLMPILPEMGAIPPHWATYFTADDADEAARQAASLGATICVPPQDISGVGRFCGITSPQGVKFYVIKYLR